MTMEHSLLDQFWVLMSAVLVVAMQAGFSNLESGLVRAKNSINVAFKNLIDFCIAALIYAAVGFGLMFGPSWSGLIGTDPGLLLGAGDAWLYVFFFFQVAFCGTATTIVSGAVAERMRFSAYCACSVVISLLVYPVAGHWAWGGALFGDTPGWLSRLGFIDFAGSTVVHSIGGWVALACLLIIGPRAGRFGPNGRPIEGHDLPAATLGVFLLWVGWFGFNGGSALAFNEQVPLIVVNTALAAAAGGIAAGALTWSVLGRPAVSLIMNGVIAGLVAITANCHLVTPIAAMFVGAVGGLICVGGTWLLERLRIDDAVGAVPVHLFAGIWGTLAVALCAPAGSWGEGVGRGHQLGVQLLGIVAMGGFAFALSYAAMRLIALWMPLRVSAADERIGLNIIEHGASDSLLDLIVQMDGQARRGDFSRRVDVEPETEAARIAAFYNSVLDKFHVENDRRHMAMKKLAQLANYDTLTGLANRRLLLEALRRALYRAQGEGSRGFVLFIDLDDFKVVNDRYGHEVGDRLLKHVAACMAGLVRDTDVLARLGGDEFALLMNPVGDVSDANAMAERLLAALSEPIAIGERMFHIHASIGLSAFDGSHVQWDEVLRQADHAMYLAKLAGKGSYRHFEAGNDDFAPAV